MSTIRHYTTSEYADVIGVTPTRLARWAADGDVAPAITEDGVPLWRHEEPDPAEAPEVRELLAAVVEALTVPAGGDQVVRDRAMSVRAVLRAVEGGARPDRAAKTLRAMTRESEEVTP